MGRRGIRGDRRRNDNPFIWDKIILNLPGSVKFDPRKVLVYKLNGDTQRVATDFVTFVDDIRAIGGNYIECTSAMYRIATMLNYLDEQNPTRKIRDASLTPGMWIGVVMETDDKNIYLSTSQEKWDKGKAIIDAWWSVFEANNDNSRPYFDHKDIQRKRDFLVHLSTIHPWIRPLLKGVHHTLEVWRGKCDTDGWKFTEKELNMFEKDKVDESENNLNILSNIMEYGRLSTDTIWDRPKYSTSSIDDPPETVRAIPRLKQDTLALKTLMSNKVPIKRFIRESRIAVMRYGFGDAFGI